MCSDQSEYEQVSLLPLPLLWWAAVTGLALASSAGALRSASAMLPQSPAQARSRLLQLHVRQLRLNPSAGLRPQYEMRGPTRLHVV